MNVPPTFQPLSNTALLKQRERYYASEVQKGLAHYNNRVHQNVFFGGTFTRSMRTQNRVAQGQFILLSVDTPRTTIGANAVCNFEKMIDRERDFYLTEAQRIKGDNDEWLQRRVIDDLDAFDRSDIPEDQWEQIYRTLYYTTAHCHSANPSTVNYSSRATDHVLARMRMTNNVPSGLDLRSSFLINAIDRNVEHGSYFFVARVLMYQALAHYFANINNRFLRRMTERLQHTKEHMIQTARVLGCFPVYVGHHILDFLPRFSPDEQLDIYVAAPVTATPNTMIGLPPTGYLYVKVSVIDTTRRAPSAPTTQQEADFQFWATHKHNFFLQYGPPQNYRDKCYRAGTMQALDISYDEDLPTPTVDFNIHQLADNELVQGATATNPIDLS